MAASEAEVDDGPLSFAGELLLDFEVIDLSVFLAWSTALDAVAPAAEPLELSVAPGINRCTAVSSAGRLQQAVMPQYDWLGTGLGVCVYVCV